MDNTELRTTIIATLQTIAPEVQADELRDERPLRQQVDLDSMDWLNFLIALHQRLQVEIPESEYGKLVTLTDIAAFIRAQQQAHPT
jgi:acyl carrier protein